MAEKWQADSDGEVAWLEKGDETWFINDNFAAYLNALEAGKAALLEALEGVVNAAKPASSRPVGAAIAQAAALLARFRSEDAEVTKATPKTCMFCFIEDPVACVYKGEAFCGLGAEVKASE